ncbi:hypothetical protein NMY22_g13527 [Coprinellus aureogranulatus]|nr:hypothetical protein NMY22_g13527 [Coprinellus aureogranulatus]
METLTGFGGVKFSMQPGEGGVLPGYPTSEGMNKMVQERMVDDRIREAREAGKKGIETSTNTFKRVPHMEPRGPVQVPAPLGPPVNAENLAVPASAPGPHGGLSRAESDVSVQSVCGSTTSDMGGGEEFTGNKTPKPVDTGSAIGMLGAPIVGKGVKVQNVHEYSAPAQRN